MSRLSDDEFFRLEALRLAVQAGDADLRQKFYDFLTANDKGQACCAAGVADAVSTAMSAIDLNRSIRGFEDGT